MKKKLRKLVIADDTFLWKVEVSYRKPVPTALEFLATVIVTVYKDGFKNSPLKVFFEMITDPIYGTEITCDYYSTNLYKPSNIRLIINESLIFGWNPNKSQLIIDDGFKLLSSN